MEVPGPITNKDFLELEPEFLHGTKPETADKGNEHECIDRYIKQEAKLGPDYKICSPEIW